MAHTLPARLSDPAALGSALLAGAVTLALGEGRYDLFDLGIGLSLVSMLAGYYRAVRLSSWSWRGGFGWFARATAFGAIVGLVVAMMCSWPIQKWVVGTPSRCEDAWKGSSHGMPRPYVEDEIDACAGEAADYYVLFVWLVIGVLSLFLHLISTRPARVATDADPSPDVDATATLTVPGPSSAPDATADPASDSAPNP
ncbi:MULTISPECIES: hypothetical protein [unclassified Streptomyces]|uniref:hypothetical protein n=1 Tax=unclassified Streptomyces TaxID=2593676 RepID=UPI0036E09625